MRLPLLLSLSLLLLAGQRASAQLAPAEDFFHSGAQLYITNNVAGAKQIVEQGRKLYPNDEKLKKLEELLKQQSQQQQQDQSQQQKSDDQKNQQQQQPKDSEDQKKQDEQNKNPEDQKKEEQKKQDKKPEDQKKDGDKKDEEAQPVKAGEMTPEEAKRLLDSQKGNEQLLQLKPQEKPRKTNRPIKDW